LAVVAVDDLLSRDLERQAAVGHDVGCQYAYIVAAAIKVAREFADTNGTDDIGRRKRERNN